MKRVGVVLLYAAGGYLISAIAGYFLVGVLSSNTHDRSVEAAMTGVFVAGPLGAVAFAIAGVLRSGRGATRTGPA